MTVVIALIAGSILGFAYMGHLWRDVRVYVQTGKRSLRWGMFVRLSGVAIGLVCIGRTGGHNLIAALIALILTRSVLVWRVGRLGNA